MFINLCEILIVLILCHTVNLKKCNKNLGWTPGYLRHKVFLTFINHVNCPTWYTRDSFTRKPSGLGTLSLPKDVPFSFYCGACFSSLNNEANLTAKIDNGDLLNLTPILNRHNEYKHVINRDINCLLSYGVTSPLRRNGIITCNLNRIRRTDTEHLYFKVRNTNLKEEKEKVVKVNNKGEARLQCAHLELANTTYVAYVWHYPAESGQEVEVAVPKSNEEILFKPIEGKKRVVCSTYSFNNPSTVWQQSYKVIGRVKQVSKSQWRVQEEYTHVPKYKSFSGKSIVIIVGIIVGVICIASILLCISTGVCHCKRSSYNSPQTNNQNMLRPINK